MLLQSGNPMNESQFGRYQENLSCPTSVSDFTNVLQDERSTIPINTLLKPVESLPKRVGGGGPQFPNPSTHITFYVQGVISKHSAWSITRKSKIENYFTFFFTYSLQLSCITYIPVKAVSSKRQVSDAMSGGYGIQCE